MSCDPCDFETEAIQGLTKIAYVRIGNGNVAIIGCEDHLRQLIEKLRAAQENPKP